MSQTLHPIATGPSFEIRIRRVLGILLGGMLVVAAGGVLSAWALADAARDVDRVEAAKAALGGVMEGMVDQESGVRGFVLTGQEPFLESYVPGGADADASRALFADLVRDLGSVADLDELERAIASWREIAEDEIDLVRSGRPDGAVEIVRSGAAKQRFDVVRAQVRFLEGELDDVINLRNQRQTELEKLVAVVGIAMLAGASAVILAMLRWLRRSVTRPLAMLAGAVAQSDGQPFSAIAGDAAGEVAALALSADRLRTIKDTERNHAVLVAEQDERSRVVADLHDGPVQSLFALQLQLQDALRPETDAAVTAAVLGRAIDVLEQTQADLRSLMFDLAPPGLGERPLADVVASIVAEVVDPELRCRVSVPSDIEFALATQLVVCRVIVEAARNANRHAAATEVDVRISRDVEGATIVVADDGRGFEVAIAPVSGHFGLGLMRSLVESVGGSFSVSSGEGVGTMVRAVVPAPSGVIEVDEPVSNGDHHRLEL